MRSLLLSLVALFLVAPASAVGFNILGGVDLQGEIGSGDVSVDTDRGYSIGAEIEHSLDGNLKLGLGLEYLTPRDLDDGSGEVDAFSIYALARWSIFGPFYIAGRYGFSDLSADQASNAGSLDLDSGTHWGIGAGLQLADHWRVELFHNKFDGEVSANDVEGVGVNYDYDYETTLARLVYSF